MFCNPFNVHIKVSLILIFLPIAGARRVASAATSALYVNLLRVPTTRTDIHPSFVYSQLRNIPFIEDGVSKGVLHLHNN